MANKQTVGTFWDNNNKREIKSEENKIIENENEIVFNTPTENWTDTFKIEMLGLFDTLDYQDEHGNLVKPLVVLKLPESQTALKGETLILAPGAIKLSLTDL